MRIFICYAHEDKSQILELVELLRYGGADPWYDMVGLLPGVNWPAELLKQITVADAFLYALTPKAVASEWCLWEFAKAIELGKPVIPILLQKGVSIPKILANIQYADFSETVTLYKVAALIGGIFNAKPIPPELAPPILRQPNGPPPQATTAAQPTPKFESPDTLIIPPGPFPIPEQLPLVESLAISNVLQEQIANRIDLFIASGGDYRAFNRKALIENIAQRLSIIPKQRILPIQQPDQVTEIPDSYIDRLITYSISESARITELKAGDDAAWNHLYKFIYRTAYFIAAKYVANVSPSEQMELAQDFAQQCSELVYSQLTLYYYDVPFNDWVSRIVTYQIINNIRPTKFFAQFSHLSFTYDRDDEQNLSLADMISDEQALAQLAQVENLADLHAGLSKIPARYQAIIQRRLNGESIAHIANELNTTQSGVSKLLQRALIALNDVLQVE